MLQFHASFLGGQVMVDDAPLALRQVATCRCLSVSQDFTWGRLIGPSRKQERSLEHLKGWQMPMPAFTMTTNNGNREGFVVTTLGHTPDSPGQAGML